MGSSESSLEDDDRGSINSPPPKAVEEKKKEKEKDKGKDKDKDKDKDKEKDKKSESKEKDKKQSKKSKKENGKSVVNYDDFEKVKFIGSGSFAKVYLVRQKSTGKLFAMKDIKKSEVAQRKEIEHLIAEREILLRINNPFIVRMHYWFSTSSSLVFILDYVDGGELFAHLRRLRRFSVDQVRLYAAELTLALSYLHDSGIIYRDLKPENILLTGRGHIKLTDFGLSKIFDSQKMSRMGNMSVSAAPPDAGSKGKPGTGTTDGGVGDKKKTHGDINIRMSAGGKEADGTVNALTFCGTAEYMAPEILTGKGHGRGVDWWALGVLIYEMLVGVPPFYSSDRRKMFKKIMEGNVRWPEDIMKKLADTKGVSNVPNIKIPAVVKDFVTRLLTKDRKLRLGSSDQGGSASVMRHPFFAGIDWAKVGAKVYKPVFIPGESREVIENRVRQTVSSQSKSSSSHHSKSKASTSSVTEKKKKEGGDEGSASRKKPGQDIRKNSVYIPCIDGGTIDPAEFEIRVDAIKTETDKKTTIQDELGDPNGDDDGSSQESTDDGSDGQAGGNVVDDTPNRDDEEEEEEEEEEMEEEEIVEEIVEEEEEYEEVIEEIEEIEEVEEEEGE